MARSGPLRHRVNIRKDTSDAGEATHVDDYQTHKTNQPANVTQVSGRETVYGFQIGATTTHLIEVRFDESITPAMVIDYGNKTLTIDSIVDKDGRQRRMFLMCASYEV